MIWKKQPVGSKLSDLQNNKASKDTATQSAAGLMSAADKTKLDGIATGATAVSVVNSLDSDSTTSALSAAQGKALNSKLTKQVSDNISTHSDITTVTSKIVKRSLGTIALALDITIGNNAIPAWSVIATSNDIKPTDALTTTVTIANVTTSQMVFCSYLNFATDGKITIPVALSANTRYIIRAVGI